MPSVKLQPLQKKKKSPKKKAKKDDEEQNLTWIGISSIVADNVFIKYLLDIVRSTDFMKQ